MYAAKHTARTLLKDLTELNSQNKQWAALKSENEKKSAADGGSDIDVEDVGCSICGLLESTEENDILLCDRAGCVCLWSCNIGVFCEFNSTYPLI